MRADVLPAQLRTAWEWWFHRNPHYALSAVAMAIAARITLVSPGIAAGDVQNILQTFASLQGYEIALLLALLLLRRFRRGRDDLVSVRVVAALFWTGPLTATTEMAARDATLGAWLAASAGLLALAELASVRRAAGLRSAPASLLVAVACLVVLTSLPPFLAHCDSFSGWRETLLFATWLMAAALISVSALAPTRRLGRRGWWELAWRAVHVGALLAQLWGMNYAFFVRGALFFAAPSVASVALVALHPLARARFSEVRRLGFVVALPFFAIALAAFDTAGHPTLARLPVCLRDPVSLTFLSAIAVWVCAASLLRSRVLVHLSMAAIILVAWRNWPLAAVPAMPNVAGPAAETSTTALALYACAVYMLIWAWLARGRIEACLGFAIGVSGALQPQFEYVRFIALVTLGWSIWPLLVRFSVPHGLAAAATAVTLLAYAFDGADAVRSLARIHTLAAPLGLILFGWVFRRCDLALGGAATGAAAPAFHIARWWASGAAPPGLAVTLLAYGLLAVGVAVSWRKPRRRPRAQP